MMRELEIVRPFVWIGFTAFGALLLASFLGAELTAYLCIICLISAVLLLIIKFRIQCRYAIILLITASLFFGSYSFLYQTKAAPYAIYANEKRTIHAEVLSLPEENSGKFYYNVKVHSIGELNDPINMTIRLSHREALEAEIGDTVHCLVRFYDFDTHPGLSSKASHLAKGTVLGAYIADHETVVIEQGARTGIRFHLSKLRQYLNDRITESLPIEEASVLSAMLIGMRDAIPDTVNNNYRDAGASHILVISGTHMSSLVQFMLDALVSVGVRRRYAICLTYPAVILFMAISGFSASVLRSGIMQLIWLTGLLLGRKPDSLNSLAIAALLLLTANPFAIGDISLLLSFSASLGMITLSPRMIEFCTARIEDPHVKYRVLKVVVPVISSVSAVLGALPVQLYAFGTINVLSVITSLLVLYASAWIIRLGMPTVILLSIPFLSPAASPLLLVTGLLIRYQNFITAFVSKHFPDPVYIAGSYVQSFVLILTAFLLLARWIYGNKPMSAAVYISAAILILSTVTTNYLLTKNQVKLVVLHNDYASCVAVQRNRRAAVISCSGSGAEVSDFLRDHGTHKVEWLFVGDTESEIRCAEELYSAFKTENVLIPNTVYFPAVRYPYVYHYGTDLPISENETVYLSSNGDRIDFEILGNRITFNTNNAGYMPYTADILITDHIGEPLKGSLTVVYSDKSPRETDYLQTAGEYVFTSEYNAICLTFTPDGKYQIRSG